MPENVAYPRVGCYTLQWLKAPPDRLTSNVIPNNRDATLKRRSREAKPSDLLLHYNYGAAAVKQWGHGIQTFQQLPKARTRLARPPHSARRGLLINGRPSFKSAIQPEMLVEVALAIQ